MKLFYTSIAKILFASSLIIFTQSLQAAVAVITHADNDEIGMSKSKLARIYLGTLKYYANGDRIIAVNLPKSSATYKKFYKTVVKKSNTALNRHWSKLKYTGKGKPAKTLATTREVLTWVTNTKGAIGYIDGKYLTKDVNVVLILP